MKKNFLVVLLLCLCTVFCAIGLVACGCNDTESVDNRDKQIVSIYNTYVAYAEENGQTPLSYEEWLNSIKGKDGINGLNGKDGLGIKSVTVNSDGHLIIIYTDNNSVDVGLVKGANGQNGITPTISISEDGYWIINNEKTTVKAEGTDGQNGQAGKDGNDGVDGLTPYIKDGYWWIGETNTNVKAQGIDGKDGQDGVTPTISISVDGYWVINGQKTDTKAVGVDGQNGQAGKDGNDGIDGLTPYIKDGYWWIGETNTNVKAQGTDGKDGADGQDGVDGNDGNDGVGIADMKIENGKLYVKYTNNKDFVELGQVLGVDGNDGRDGVGIKNIELVSDNFIKFILTNGEFYLIEFTINSDEQCQHDFDTVNVSSTCVAEGYTVYTCKSCGYSYSNNYVSVTGHHFYEHKCIFCGANESFGIIEPDTEWYSNTNYIINTREELAGLAYLVNRDGVNFSGKTIKLGCDIDLGSAEWEPIGTDITAFAGTFDGQEFSIKNLKVDKEQSYCGLFGNVSGATIKNLKIDNANILVNTVENYVGIVCGYADDTIFTNISSSGYIDANCSQYVGGICGYLCPKNTTYSNLSNEAKIVGDSYVGGIFGEAYYKKAANNCYYTFIYQNFINKGDVTGRRDYVGGISGYLYIDNDHAYGKHKVIISEMTNTGAITGKGYVGGLIGYGFADDSTSTISYSQSSGKVSGTSDFGNAYGKLSGISYVEW